MSERDEQWQAQQDALALEDTTDAGLDFDEADQPDETTEPHWGDELDFYASLAEHATRDAAPTSDDDAMVEAALAAVPADASASPVARRFALLTTAMAVAAVALLWAAWPERTLLRGVEHSWTTQAQDVLGVVARRLAQAETPQAKSQPVHDVEPPLPIEPAPESNSESRPESGPEPKGAAPAVQTRRGPSPPRADAATLVATARAARGDARLVDAEQSYGELLRRFPKSAEARVGRVALAQIKLGRGKTKTALRLFSAAAKDGGPLAEEAAWGRIQALHRLRRKDALQKAVDGFVRDYPSSVYRARAQGRLNP